MGIKERIEKLGSYFINMNVAADNGIIYVLVDFPKGWGCSEVTEHNFNVKTVKDESGNFFYFFADLEIGFDKVFDAIEYNIKFNEEAQTKVTLLREKIEQLKCIFENEDINTLKTLEFKFTKKRKNIKKCKKTNDDNIVKETENNIDENTDN